MSEHPSRGRSRANWGATLLVIAGAASLLQIVLWALARQGFQSVTTLILQVLFAAFSAIALFLAMFPLAFGPTFRGPGLVGRSVLARVTLLAYGLLSMVAEFAWVGTLSENLDENNAAVAFRLGVFTASIVVGALAAYFVARAGVVSGFARWSLPVALALAVLTNVLFSDQSIDWISFVWNVPRAVGILLLGISYRQLRAERAAVATGVTKESESLAE